MFTSGPTVRFFGKSIHMREILAMTSAYARPRVQTVGVEVGRQDSLWGPECSGNFPWREVAWQHRRFSGGKSY